MYSNDDFDTIVNLRKAWFNAYADTKERNRISDLIACIEYKDYDEAQVAKIKRYKMQAIEYVKMRVIFPHKNINLKDFITEEKIDLCHQKILFLPIDIANFGHTFADAIRKCNIEAYMISFWGTHKFKYESDLSRYLFFNNYIETLEIIDFVAELIVEFDVFNFFFSYSLLPDFADLPIYRELGKKTVIHYFGSDIRLYSEAVKENHYLSLAKDTFYKNHTENEKKILSNLKKCSFYIDQCMVGGAEFRSILTRYYNNYYEYKQPISLGEFECFHKTQNEKFLIVHPPSNPAIKGTSIILEAIDELKKEYDFDFVFIQNMPRKEALAMYNKADLVIDHIIYGWFGMVTLESMALGTPVIIHIADCFKDFLHEDNPIINANPSNIKEKIEWALNNKNELIEIGKKGRKYVEEHHDSNIVTQSILDVYDNMSVHPPKLDPDTTKRNNHVDFEGIYYGLYVKKEKGKSVADYLQKNRYNRVAIYGFGTCGRLLYDELSSSDIDVKYIIDRNITPHKSSSVESMLVAKEDISICSDVDLIILTIPCDLDEVEGYIKDTIGIKVLTISELILLI
ncbi:MAG: glycosyltransferase family 4 protein [Defluviitaleaceae bacterium]|nr:glycosyltransferase family 4 protein [Defluviitaleaceae bacterium]